MTILLTLISRATDASGRQRRAVHTRHASAEAVPDQTSRSQGQNESQQQAFRQTWTVTNLALKAKSASLKKISRHAAPGPEPPALGTKQPHQAVQVGQAVLDRAEDPTRNNDIGVPTEIRVTTRRIHIIGATLTLVELSASSVPTENQPSDCLSGSCTYAGGTPQTIL